jgi:hypothetical protein
LKVSKIKFTTILDKEWLSSELGVVCNYPTCIVV